MLLMHMFVIKGNAELVADDFGGNARLIVVRPSKYLKVVMCSTSCTYGIGVSSLGSSIGFLPFGVPATVRVSLGGLRATGPGESRSSCYDIVCLWAINNEELIIHD
ncbi:unnamed protein product [Prunus armeniaca]